MYIYIYIYILYNIDQKISPILLPFRKDRLTKGTLRHQHEGLVPSPSCRQAHLLRGRFFSPWLRHLRFPKKSQTNHVKFSVSFGPFFHKKNSSNWNPQPEVSAFANTFFYQKNYWNRKNLSQNSQMRYFGALMKDFSASSKSISMEREI